MRQPSPRPAVRERFLPRGRSRLYLREIGAGPAVVVVHGGPDFDHRYLLPELDRLAAGLRLVYYDQRGRGASFSGEGAGDVTLEGEIDDLEAVREATGEERVALLGHSFGIVVALEYAVRHPGRVSHLVLLNAAPVSRAGADLFRRELRRRRTPAQAARIRELAADAGYRRGDLALDAEMQRLHFATTVARPDQLAAVVDRLRLAFTPAGIVAAREIETALLAETWDREDYDLVPELRGLPIPTLVVHGDRDFCPLGSAREIAGVIPGGRLVVLEDCGHFSFVEQPDAVASLVRGFIGSPPRGS